MRTSGASMHQMQSRVQHQTQSRTQNQTQTQAQNRGQQQMQNQVQTRRMERSGDLQPSESKNEMREIMNGLSSEERSSLQKELSSLSSDEKTAAIEKFKSVDKSSGDYFKSLLNAVTESKTSTTGLSVYA